MFSIMSNLQIHYNFKRDFQKIDHHTGDKCLIHVIKHDIKESEDHMFNQIFKENFLWEKYLRRCVVEDPALPSFRKVKWIEWI